MKVSKSAGCAALVLAAFLWATAYVVVKNMVESVPPDFLLAVRYSIATGGMLLLCLPKRKQMNRALLGAGIRMGIALFVEFYCFTVGLQYTEASKSSFIVACYIILIPPAYYVIRRKPPTRLDVFGAVLCLAGLVIIFGGGLDSINIGDVICIGSAVGYAVHVVYSAQYAKQYDGMLLNLVQIATTAVLAIVVTLCTGSWHAGFGVISLPEIGYLSVVCTIIPYFLCLLGMRVVSTTTSGILLSFETVFATILAVIFLHEQLYWQLIVGGGVILLSFILTEILRMKGNTRRKE